MKDFLISIDTEGDNLWNWRLGDTITTENAKFLSRFQNLCEEYGFKPTYLTNFEMARDQFFSTYFKDKNRDGLCEIGMHLHAWNNPPQYNLPVRDDVKPGAPYLIEYPLNVMEEKTSFLTNVLEDTFETKMVTHRAGRWATNQKYFEILDALNYKVDCSVTPLMDWGNTPGQSPNSFGSDYTKFKKSPFIIENTRILEVPVTIRTDHRLKSLSDCGVRKSIKRIKEACVGYEPVWLRPSSRKNSIDDMLFLVDKISEEKKTDYLMFMLHSSEFMPGGSPNFKDDEDIERLYSNLEYLFKYISNKFVGCTFKEYYEKRR